VSGFITLHRDIQRHWIWDDAEHLKAWCAILMACNWEEREVPCGTKVTICERGQCIRSQEQWAKLFGKNWDRSKVQRFFKLLKSANMIRTETAHKALKLTVINYSNYQDQRSDNERNLSTKRAQDEQKMSTENNYNHYNKDEEANASSSPSPEIEFFINKSCYVPPVDAQWFKNCFNRFSDDFLKLCINACKDVRFKEGLKPKPCKSDLMIMMEQQRRKYTGGGVFRDPKHEKNEKASA